MCLVRAKMAVNALKVFEYGGRRYAGGLGTLHAQEGFPLAISLDECVRRGLIPCFSTCEKELIDAGSANGLRTVQSAIADMIFGPPPQSWLALGSNKNYLKGGKWH